MYYIDNNSGSPNMPALSPVQSNTPTWFTEGDKNKGISWIGQDWLNILQAELLNILSEAGIKPDKGKLNQLTLSVKAIITANAYTQVNNLKEIFDAGIAAQAAARGHLGLGKLATKDSLGPEDVNALAKDQNLSDVLDKAKARTALQLGNSSTRNVGTTINTVAAGNDARIIATKKAIDDTQTGLAAQGVMWISTADDLSNLLSGARRFASNKAPATVLPAAGYFFIEVLAKRDTANGSCILATSDKRDVWIGTRYTVPDEANFTWIQLNQNVENLGLKETLNPTKRVSIGSLGTGMFDGRLPSINIGDSDSGFIGSADGRLDIYCNNALVGYIDGGGLHMQRDIASTGSLHAGNALLATDGNIYGSLWGNNWLNNWLSAAFTSRDNNINTRATWDWVNQHFVQDVRLAAPVEFSERGLTERVWGGVVTSWADYGGSNYHIKWRLLQKLINGQWLTVAYA